MEQGFSQLLTEVSDYCTMLVMKEFGYYVQLITTYLPVVLFLLGLITIMGTVWVSLRLTNKGLKDPKHKEVIILLGSGGHTTEMCLLLRKFHFDKVSRTHVIITKTDKSS